MRQGRSGCSLTVGLYTLDLVHHGISQRSIASRQLVSSSQRLSGHVSHSAKWFAALMSKGSRDACTSRGLTTFLHTVFTAQHMRELGGRLLELAGANVVSDSQSVDV